MRKPIRFPEIFSCPSTRPFKMVRDRDTHYVLLIQYSINKNDMQDFSMMGEPSR